MVLESIVESGTPPYLGLPFSGFRRSFHPAYTFPEGDVRHIHNLIPKADGKGYWVLTGDFEHEPGIGSLDVETGTFQWIARGAQHYRAVHVFEEPGGLLYGTDTELEGNSIGMLDVESGDYTSLAPLPGSCLYGHQLADFRVLSTTVEPSRVNRSSSAEIWSSGKGLPWSCIRKGQKDPFPRKILSIRELGSSRRLLLFQSTVLQRESSRRCRRPAFLPGPHSRSALISGHPSGFPSVLCVPGRYGNILLQPVYSDAIHPDARFPRLRYKLVAEGLRNAGLSERIAAPEPIPLEVLKRSHCPDYVDRFLSSEMAEKEKRAIGLRPWTDDIIARTLLLVGGSWMAVRSVLEGELWAANLAGGTHHAYFDRGAGYCIFNDLVVCAHEAIAHGLTRVLIIDLDVHQGDGTASMLNDTPETFTLSAHCEKNFPFRKQVSDLDIPLLEGLDDEAYLEQVLPVVEKTIRTFDPELVLYQAGVDPLATDHLGRLQLSREGLARRNRWVYDRVLGAGIPLVVTMGGGYSRPIERSVEAHVDVFRELTRYPLHGGLA